jgi:hypothetical protein
MPNLAAEPMRPLESATLAGPPRDAAPAVKPQGPRPTYFVNAPVDWLLIGGLSIATFVVFWFLGGKNAPLPRQAVWNVSAALLWIVNWPHFSATSYRLYHTKSNLTQYPVTALVVPVLLIVATVGSFLSPVGVAPWLVKMFVIWSPYHFSGQTVGISMIYARRTGFPIMPRQRFLLSGFIFGTFLVQTAMTETGQGPPFYSVSYPAFGLPGWVPTVLRIWMFGCGAAFLIYYLIKRRPDGRMYPPIVLLPAVTQFTWFGLGWRVPAFNEFVPFFHALQYLLIAWVMQVGETLAHKTPADRRRFVVLESVRWGAFNVAGGALLFWALPRLGERFGFTLPFATAVIISAVQIHHFFVDGVIWKLRNPKVASPLMSNVNELIAGTPAVAAAKAA